MAELGATIVFEKGANLYAEGALKFNGTEMEPIALKGKMPGIGYWPGVIVKSSETSFDWVRISGAKEGMRIDDGKPTIANSVFMDNEKGIHVGASCNFKAKPSFINCAFVRNRNHGIDCHHGGMSLDKCTIANNGEFGAIVGYGGDAEASYCLVSGNKEGGLRFHNGGHGSFHGSSITGNKKVDVEAHSKCDFRENWWGAGATRILQQKGDGANLPSINDGRDNGSGDIVDVAEFLTEPPKDCGATVKF